MRGLFDSSRPDPQAVRRIKLLVTEQFELTESTMLAVAELRCHEAGCPSVETVITARAADGRVRDWRIAKPVSDVARPDIEKLDNR